MDTYGHMHSSDSPRCSPFRAGLDRRANRLGTRSPISFRSPTPRSMAASARWTTKPLDTTDTSDTSASVSRALRPTPRRPRLRLPSARTLRPLTPRSDVALNNRIRPAVPRPPTTTPSGARALGVLVLDERHTAARKLAGRGRSPQRSSARSRSSTADGRGKPGTGSIGGPWPSRSSRGGRTRPAAIRRSIFPPAGKGPSSAIGDFEAGALAHFAQPDTGVLSQLSHTDSLHMLHRGTLCSALRTGFSPRRDNRAEQENRPDYPDQPELLAEDDRAEPGRGQRLEQSGDRGRAGWHPA